LVRLAFSRRTLLVTTSLVLAEVHRWLLFRAGPRPAAAALDRIEAGAIVTITFPTEVHHRSARQWLAKLADQRISYADAVSFAVMEATQCRVAMSFDRDFVIAGFRTWRLPE
jgi:predicted nucleic acid-binding protein